MKVEPLEVYAEDSNYAIVKPPGRKYPGSVIQGDSLRILCGLAHDIAQRVRDRRLIDEEFLGSVEERHSSLLERLLHYQTVLEKHGIALPYGRPMAGTDFIKLLPDEQEAQ